jgi:hypothetical protein
MASIHVQNSPARLRLWRVVAMLLPLAAVVAGLLVILVSAA